jgi:hypothetical protein
MIRDKIEIVKSSPPSLVPPLHIFEGRHLLVSLLTAADRISGLDKQTSLFTT